LLTGYIVKKVIIYRNKILPYSETFIYDYSHYLKKHSPFFLGIRKIPNFKISKENIFILNSGNLVGWLREIIFRLTASSDKIEKEIERVGPELIHAHFGPDASLIMKTAKKLKVPLITTFHGIDATAKLNFLSIIKNPSNLFYKLRLKDLKDNGKKFIAVSKFIKSKLIERGFNEKNIEVIYSGINLKKFKSEYKDKRRNVLFVGRLVEKKGCEYLIRAMKEVQEEFPESKLIIIGQGSLKNKLVTLANKLGIKAEFKGSMSHDEVKLIMDRSYIFCLPSITAKDGNSEGLPVSILEAMAMNLPVVSTYHAGIPEAIENGKEGFLVKEKDVSNISKSIKELLRNNKKWKEMSKAGRKKVEKMFDIKKNVKELEKLYEK